MNQNIWTPNGCSFRCESFYVLNLRFPLCTKIGFAEITNKCELLNEVLNTRSSNMIHQNRLQFDSILAALKD